MTQDKEYLGQGWAFPLRVDGRGQMALATGYTDIEQSIRIILGTMPGERVMRPEFGCRAWELVFAPNNATTRSLLEHYVRQALEFWEPRIKLLAVDVADEPGSLGAGLSVHIKWTPKDRHDPRSLVYPFYIMGEE